MSEIGVPFTPEHGAPDNFNSNTMPGYQPSPEDREKLQLIDSLLTRAKKYRKRYDSRWIDWYKMFRGRQWKEVRPSYRSSEVLNLIFQTIQSMIPVLTDSRPKLEFLPTVPTQFELADILSKVSDNDWSHNNWLMTLTEILYDAHIYGVAYAYVGFDPKANHGLGSIVFESRDNFHIYPDPNARDINGPRTRHFIEAEPTDIQTIKREYGDKAKNVTGDVVDLGQGDKADIYQVMFKSPTDSKLIIEGPSGYDLIAKNQALKVTLYSKDDDFDEEEKLVLNDAGEAKIDPSTDEPEKKYVQKKKYPQGRKLVSAGGVLLEDGDNEFEDGQYPYVKLVNYLLPREFYGMGEVDQLDGPQKTINKVLAYTLDLLSLMSNPIWVCDDTSGIDTDNLFNKPGLVIEKTAGSDVHREPGVELPQYVLPLLDRYRQYFDGISGETDMSRGAEPGDVTAAAAIASLQEAQQTRLRLKSRHIDAFLNDFGKLYISRVFQYYSVPRIIRVSGDPNANNFFYFHVEQLDQDENGQAFTDDQGNPMKKKFAVITKNNQTQKIEIEGDFDVKVGTGSSLPFSKQEKGQQSMDLFKLHVIDQEELLKNLDYPNYEAVITRMMKQAQQGQQAQGVAANAAFKKELYVKMAGKGMIPPESVGPIPQVPAGPQGAPPA